MLIQATVVTEQETTKISLLEPAFSKIWKTTKKGTPLGPDKTVPLLYIREKKPTEAWVVDAKEAIIDFSGVTLKAGIKFWF